MLKNATVQLPEIQVVKISNMDVRWMDLHAAQNGHAAATKQLIESRCNIDRLTNDGVSPMHITAANGHTVVTKQLIEARCNINLQMQDGSTPLFIVVQNGHAGVTKQLIEARCNIDAQKKNGVSPLFIAAEKGHAVVTHFMDLQRQDGCTALMIKSVYYHTNFMVYSRRQMNEN